MTRLPENRGVAGLSAGDPLWGIFWVGGDGDRPGMCLVGADFRTGEGLQSGHGLAGKAKSPPEWATGAGGAGTLLMIVETHLRK